MIKLSYLNARDGRPLRLAVALLAMFVPAWAALAADQVTLLDGKTVSVDIAAIDEQGQLIGADDKPLGVSMSDVRRIDRPSIAAVPLTQVPAGVIYLEGGARLFASKIATDGHKITFDCALANGLTLPMGVVRAILFEPKVEKGSLIVNGDFEALLKNFTDQEDKLFLYDEQRRVQSLSVLMDTLDDKNLKVADSAGASSEIARGRLYGIVLARIGDRTDLSGQVMLRLSDGNSVWGKLVKLPIGGALQLLPFGVAKIPLEVKWANIAAVEVRSDRLAFVSDLEPKQAEQSVIYNASASAVPLFRWQRDLAVTGTPLKLGSIVYSKGLGVYPATRLTYDVSDKQYNQFTAVIGIDAAAVPPGDATFIVLADGQELFRATVKGTEPPKTVSLKITGVKQVTLVVEAAGIDSGGHADWCDARFLK